MPHQLHQLAEQHLGLAGGEAEGLHPRLQRLHLAVVVGAPDVDEVLPPALELVAVVRDVVAEIGGGAVGLHQHAVTLVAEVGGPQPGGATLVEHDAAGPEVVEHAPDVARLVQRAFGEPGVEVHAETPEVVLEALHRVPVPPLPGLLLGHRVAELAPHPFGHVDDVLALVAVLRRRLPAVAGDQRGGEGVELVPGVVQVVLAVHDGALGRQEVGEGIAHRHPTPAARVQGAGGVGRHELEVDAEAVERVPVTVALARGGDREEHLVQPRGRQVQVQEPGTRDLDPLQVRRAGTLELDHDLGGDVARRHPERLGELEGDVGGEVAVQRVVGRGQLDARGRRREAGRVERGVQCGEQLVTDHEGRRRPAPFAARRARAW